MNSFKFISRTNPQTTGFIVDGERRYDSRHRGVCSWAMFYQTYGDGEVQHSAETPFSRQLLPDFLGSLACELAEATVEKRNEMLALLCHNWPRHGKRPEAIRFALSLKCREDKTQYYNLAECKVSTSASKANDRRWEAIKTYDSHFDGSINMAASILHIGDEPDDIYRLFAWKKLLDVATEERGYTGIDAWKEFKIDGCDGWTETAWTAICWFVQGYILTKDAKEQSARWLEYGRKAPKEGAA